jgi:hypothetical protein
VIGRAALASATLLAVPSPAATVPFVGCPSDGQLGPQPAPARGKAPDVAGPDAARLAFYMTSDGAGVLAPRGWHCFGSLGSNGMGVTVVPGPIDQRAMFGGGKLGGPAVQLFQTSGGTSGRFHVAEVAGRLFPRASAYVARVEAEGVMDHPLPRTPFPADRRTYRGPFQLLYTTPAGREGQGTASGLARGPLPIDGVEWLHPIGDMDLTSLAVRLPPSERPLVAAIIRQATPPPR